MSIPQLSRLLPLPDEELKQVLEYAATLSKQEAAEHFSNLLGDSPGAVDFIASFNSRRKDPKASAAASASASRPGSQPGSQPGSSHASDMDTVPKSGGRQKKKKAQIHALPPRQVTNLGPAPGTAYSKNLQDDYYMPGRPGPSATSSGRASPVKQQQQQQQQQTPAALIAKSATPPPSKQPPSAQGHLISDMPKSNKAKSTSASRSSTPGPKTKINISGGTAMRGASTVLTDLEAAIRALEISTNPTQIGEDSARRCNCVAARHPLLSAAPNCLSCGKVICVKEGLGPCTFCGAPLLSSHEVQSMIRELRQEQGREKMAANKEAHRRPDVSKTPAPFSKPREDLGEAEAKALEHRDRLLGFQAQNAQRTTIRDEASDFDVVGAMAGTGGSIWTSPEERARELKRQQKILREMEWNAKPEYEKRQQVVSIDLVGKKVVKRMAAIERPKTPEEEEGDNEPGLLSKVLQQTSGNGGGGGGGGRAGGTFSKNPLLGGLIKPVLDGKGKGAELPGRKDKATRWRRVQDDLDNNEAVILDGGAYGGSGTVDQEPTKAVADEPGCG